jgi:hypothetical protein
MDLCNAVSSRLDAGRSRDPFFEIRFLRPEFAIWF